VYAVFHSARRQASAAYALECSWPGKHMSSRCQGCHSAVRLRRSTVSRAVVALVASAESPCRGLPRRRVDRLQIWETVVPEFAKYYRVIGASLRHYYPERWDGKGSDFSYEQHAADVAYFDFLRLIKATTLADGSEVQNEAHASMSARRFSRASPRR